MRETGGPLHAPAFVQIVLVGNTMFQLIAAVFGFAAGAFAWSGDPVIGFLLAVCTLVWIASTTGRVPLWAARLRKHTFIVRPE
jgi:hypothetical protein